MQEPTSSSSVLGTNVRTSPSSSPTTSALGTNVGTSPAHPNLGNKLLPSSSVTSETYSRKVFIGGLPPDIDEGKPTGGTHSVVLLVDIFSIISRLPCTTYSTLIDNAVMKSLGT